MFWFRSDNMFWLTRNRFFFSILQHFLQFSNLVLVQRIFDFVYVLKLPVTPPNHLFSQLCSGYTTVKNLAREAWPVVGHQQSWKTEASSPE